MTPIPKPRYRWRVPAADGIAHAFTSLPAAPCGVRNQPEKFDYWGTAVRCPLCAAHLEEVTKEAVKSI
jgi:hypothetical protein